MRLTDFEHNERTGKIAALGSIQLSENRGGNSMSAKLTTKVGDYRNVEILPDSVIYCDPPYKDTGDYGIEFDHEAFYDWCEKQTSLVIISEYWMPEDRFVCIAEFERKSTFSPTNNSTSRIEKVFVPKGQLEMYKRIMNK